MAKYLFLLLGFSLMMKAQIFPEYKISDSIALSLPAKKYYYTEETTLELTQGLKTENEKCRAIFRWITNNIKYSYKNMTDNPDLVFWKQMGVCEGYAQLFKRMCQEAHISCFVIYGDATPYYVGHAWNIVRLDGKWYIMEPTWASGGLAGFFRKRFIKRYNNIWWKSDYYCFIKSHVNIETPEWYTYIVPQYEPEKMKHHGFVLR